MGDVIPKTSKIVLTQTVDISQWQATLAQKELTRSSSLHDDRNHVNDAINSSNKQPQDMGFSKSSSRNEHNHATFVRDDTDLIDLSDPDVPDWIQKREMTGGNTVEKLEKRLKQLESFNNIENNVQDCVANSTQPIYNQDFVSGRHIHSIASFYDDSKATNNVMCKTPIHVNVRDSDIEEGTRSKSLSGRGVGSGQTDVELNKLKTELQRQDLEIHKLRDDLKQLKSLENEEDRNTVADKFVDKVNTVRMPSIISGYERHHDVSPSKPDANHGFNSHRALSESFNGTLYRCGDNQDGQESSYGSPKRDLSSKGLIISMKDKITARRLGIEMGQTMIPDMDSSRSISMMQFQLNSLLSTLELSMEKLCNSFWMRGSRDTDSSMTDSGRIEDELFVLTKTVYKLKDLYQDFAYHFFNNEAGKDRIINSQKQLAQSEFRVTTLESLCIQKDRKVEELECQIHSILKELESGRHEKYELTSIIQKMYKEAEEQRYRIKELLGINEELLQFSQAKEEKLGSLQITKDHLTQQVIQYQEKTARLEGLLKQKDKEGEELKRRLKAGQIATEEIIFEKIDLASKIQKMQKEAEEQHRRINELISINEELLEFSQMKEDQSRALPYHIREGTQQASDGVHGIDDDHTIMIEHVTNSSNNSSSISALLKTAANRGDEDPDLNPLLD